MPMTRFYEIYQKAFLRSTEDLMRPSPVILMFLNFGFMDVELLGEEHTNTLYNLVDSLGLFHSESLGIGVDYLAKNHQAWVLTSWQIVLNSMPKLAESVTTQTWAYDMKGFYGYCNDYLWKRKRSVDSWKL